MPLVACQIGTWLLFGFFMRDCLTTGDIARASGYTLERIRQKWADGTLPAELANPGGKQPRFKKTQRIQDWCKECAAKRRLPQRNRKQAREILGAAFTSFEIVDQQWKLLRRQIGDSYRDWSIEQIREAQEFMKPALDFAEELRNKLCRAEGDHFA
jgi:hypothetical protein